MCHAPCCGTPEEMEKLIKLGYRNRLMFDDWPGQEDLIKPALKGYGGKKAPWETRTEKGCTFWKKGKCELHKLGLKPMVGRLAHHSNSLEDSMKIEDVVRESWRTEKAKEVIQLWKKKNERT